MKNKIELGQVGKVVFRVAVVLAMLGLAACGGGETISADQIPLSTPTLSASSTPPPDNTPAPRYVQVRNPFTGVVYTIDENGCAVIPAGGTAYGAATVLGDPGNPLDITPLEFIEQNGTSRGKFDRPNDLPSLSHPNDKVCPVNMLTPTSPIGLKGPQRLTGVTPAFHRGKAMNKPFTHGRHG